MQNLMVVIALTILAPLALLRFGRQHSTPVLLATMLTIAIAAAILLAANNGQIAVDIGINLNGSPSPPP